MSQNVVPKQWDIFKRASSIALFSTANPSCDRWVYAVEIDCADRINSFASRAIVFFEPVNKRKLELWTMPIH
jgi:hypothetical protein